MSAPVVRSEAQVSRRHNVGAESFYVEIHRRATLNEALSEIVKSEVECIAIYLGDGMAGACREDGHNQRVGISREMALWLYHSLGDALAQTEARP